MIQATSLKAFESVKETLNPRQRVILNWILAQGEACNAQIAEGLGWPINCVTPRVLELRGMNLLTDCGARPSRFGRCAHFWRVNDQIKHIRLVSNPKPSTFGGIRENAAGGRVSQGELFQGEL